MMDDWRNRASYHLDGWGIWRRTNGGVVGRGYDSKSPVLESGGSKYFDHMVEAVDARCAKICDGIIDGLPDLFKNSLELHYIHAAVWRYNRAPTNIVLEDAQAAFWQIARKWLV